MSAPADGAPREHIRAHFVDVGARLVAKSAQRRDEDLAFDRDLWRAVCAEGLFRFTATADRCAALEGLAEGGRDLGFAVTACAHAVVVEMLRRHGSDAQQTRLLPKLLDGTWLGACANAEPGAGTDVMGLKSRAWLQGDGYVLSARKRSVTNLGACDVALVSARLLGVPAKESVNVFIVEPGGGAARTGAPRRVWQRRRHDLAGLRTSPTGSLVAWRSPLAEDALLGARGSGVQLFRAMFSDERLTTGHLYLGALRACLAQALDHAETRRQFGQVIGKNQYVQEKVVKMRVAVELLEAHLAAVGARSAAGDDVFGSLSVVKAFGVEAALEAAQDLVRLLGARGMSREGFAERMVRDLLGLSILGGTVELQKIVIYAEAQKARARAQRPEPQTPPQTTTRFDPGLTVRVVDAATLTPAEEQALVSLVARTFPGEEALRGRYFYDSEPAFVVLAERAGVLVGARVVVLREALQGARSLKLAGIGIVVDEQARRQGVGSKLTAAMLAELSARGVDVAVAFLLTQHAEGLLRRHGFSRLQARVTFQHRQSGALVVESAPCFVRGLSSASLVDELEARGELHLGVGTW